MKNIVAIIQTRMGSTRLPGKVMLDLSGKKVLEHVVDRTRLSKLVNDVVVATTIESNDDVIAEFCKEKGINCVRGSEYDVIERYLIAAKKYNADIVVRVTSDCPLLDFKVLDKMLKEYNNSDCDILTNAGDEIGQRTYPRGLDVEIFSMKWLKKAGENATNQFQKEHVTPYIYENAKKIIHYKDSEDNSNYRWTLDTDEDFELIDTIYKELYRGKHDFFLKEILELVRRKPEISKINEHVEQKKS